MNKLSFLPLIVIVLSSCAIGKSVTETKAKKEFTVENHAIPPEFGEDKNTYLIGIIQGSPQYQKYLRINFEKAYNGKDLLLTNEEMNSEKYSDITVYRYIFGFLEGSTSSTTYSSGLSSSTTSKKYYVYDRVAKKRYITGAEFPYFAKAMEVYLEQLESKRINSK